MLKLGSRLRGSTEFAVDNRQAGAPGVNRGILLDEQTDNGFQLFKLAPFAAQGEHLQAKQARRDVVSAEALADFESLSRQLLALIEISVHQRPRRRAPCGHALVEEPTVRLFEPHPDIKLGVGGAQVTQLKQAVSQFDLSFG
jgi:hypothetical protein